MHTKKSLGQHFLKSKSALRAMVAAGDVSVNDVILEVGPGRGALTEYLVKPAAKVIALEKDESLAKFLREKFSQEIAAGRLEIIEGDILEFDPDVVRSKMSPGQKFKIIANIPYYITGAFIKKFLTASLQPERMVLLVQKEVAERIVARNGKESILSLSINAYGTPRYIETVKAKYFSPAPKVDSAIIAITGISRDFFKNLPEDAFFELVKTGFAHKRKQLAGNLKNMLKNGKSAAILELFRKLSLNPSTRAEDVTLENWKKIAKKLQETA